MAETGVGVGAGLRRLVATHGEGVGGSVETAQPGPPFQPFGARLGPFWAFFGLQSRQQDPKRPKPLPGGLFTISGPKGVILGHFGGHFGSFWGHFWAISGHFGSFWAILGYLATP